MGEGGRKDKEGAKFTNPLAEEGFLAAFKRREI